MGDVCLTLPVSYLRKEVPSGESVLSTLTRYVERCLTWKQVMLVEVYCNESGSKCGDQFTKNSLTSMWRILVFNCLLVLQYPTGTH